MWSNNKKKDGRDRSKSQNGKCPEGGGEADGGKQRECFWGTNGASFIGVDYSPLYCFVYI